MAAKSNILKIKQSNKITWLQMLLLLITVVISSADIFPPKFVAQDAMQDSWISVIIATVSSLIIANIFVTLGTRFPNKTLVQYSSDILGKPLGIIVGLIYIHLFIDIARLVLRELSELYIMCFNNDAPMILYNLLAIAFAMLVVSKGLKSIAIVNTLLFPIAFFSLGFIAIVVLPLINLKHFLPILNNGIIPSLKGAFVLQGWLLETMIILPYIPFLNEKKNARKVVSASIGFLGLMFLTGILAFAVFGNATEKLLFPALYFVRVASLGSYLERLDILFLGIWISGLIIKLLVFYHISLIEISNLFSLKSFKFMIIPVGILIFVLSLSANKIEQLLHTIHYTFPYHIFFMAFIIPAILLLVSILRGQKET